MKLLRPISVLVLIINIYTSLGFTCSTGQWFNSIDNRCQSCASGSVSSGSLISNSFSLEANVHLVPGPTNPPLQNGDLMGSVIIYDDVFDQLLVTATKSIDCGGIYVYERDETNPSGWKEHTTSPFIQHATAAATDLFGGTMEIVDNHLVVGAFRRHVGPIADAGGVFTFVRNYADSTWTEVGELTYPSALTQDDFIGMRVSLSQLSNGTSVLAVGGHGWSGGDGVIWIYTCELGSTNWQFSKEILGASSSFFGIGVAVSPEASFVVGGSSVEGGTGSARLYMTESNWDPASAITLSPIGISSGAQFGRYVDATEDIVVVGAHVQESNGRVLGFGRNEGGPNNWGQIFSVLGSANGDQFGRVASILNNTVIVGAHGASHGWTDNGGTYLYHKDYPSVGSWGLFATLYPTVSNYGCGRRSSLGLDGSVYIGCEGNDAFGTDAGAAYAFPIQDMFCTECSLGQTPTIAGDSCTDCLAGTYGIAGGLCTDCPIGTFNPNNGSTTVGDCVSCSIIGTHAPVAGLSECIGCAAGSYGEVAGECIDCPLGTASSIIGANSSAVCQDCLPGYFADTAGSTECSACPIGDYQPFGGQSQCLTCGASTYSGVEGSTECIECPIGSISDAGSTSIDDCVCTIGFYGSGAECTACPEGGECDGGEFPIAIAGYWSDPNNPEVIAACSNPDACLGGTSSSCVEGYSGTLCSECDTGYYTLGVECRACPSYANLIIPVVIIGLLVVVLFKLKYGSARSGTSTLVNFTILLNYAQILSVVPTFNVPWPPQLRVVFDLVSIFNFNIEYASPECSVEMDFYVKTIAKLFLPIVLLGLFLILGLPFIVLEKKKKKREGEKYNEQSKSVSFIARSLGGYLSLFILSYTMIAASVFDLLRCRDLGHDTFVLAAAPAKVCYDDDHQVYSFIAYAFGALYFLIIPGAVALSFLTAKKHGTVFDPVFQAIFNALVASYNTDWFWYELVILSKKLFTLVATLFASPLDQLLLGLVVFFCFALLQSYAQPYMNSNLNKLELYSTISLLVTLFTGLLYLYWAETPPENPFTRTFILTLSIVGIAVTFIAAFLSIITDVFNTDKKRSRIAPMTKTYSKLAIAQKVGEENLSWMSDEQAYLVASFFGLTPSGDISKTVADELKCIDEKQRRKFVHYLSTLHPSGAREDPLLKPFAGAYSSLATEKLNELNFNDRQQVLSVLERIQDKTSTNVRSAASLK